MRTSLAVIAVTLSFGFGPLGISHGEEVEILVASTYKRGEAFKAKSLLLALTESQAIAIGRVNGQLDLDAHIDCIETPLEDVIVHFFRGRGLIIAIDVDGFKKASVTRSQLVTYQPVDKLPLRKCLHDVLDPLGLTFVVCPDGLLITSAPEKAEK